MIFSYQPALIASPESGEPLLILRPEIYIRIAGPKRAKRVRALVDTGADNTILPLSVARLCGIELSLGTGPQLEAFGGQKIVTHFGDVVFELGKGKDRVRWPARVQFFEFPSVREESIVLGHAGFLDFFEAAFDGYQARLKLAPNADLPALE